jgi:flagellar hook protein FlgE
MMDAMYNGMSGLNTFQKTINIESNNISNINTIAYKTDRVSFADMIYQNSFGKGTSIASVQKNFNQGGLKLTENPFDMAISGKGFFTVKGAMTDQVYYTRAGNFRRNIDGFLQIPSNERVQGVSIDTPTVVTTNKAINKFGSAHTNFLASQTINSGTLLQTINTKSTDYKKSATDSGISGDGYKSASSKIKDIEYLSTMYRSQLSLYNNNPISGTSSTQQVSSFTIPIGSLTNYGDTTEIYIDGLKYSQSYDISESNTLKKFSDQLSNIRGVSSKVDTTTGKLTIMSMVPGKELILSDAKYFKNGFLNNSVVDITTPVIGNGQAAVVSVRDALKKAVEDADAEFLEITNTINLADEERLILTDLQMKLDTLGVSDNILGTFSSDNGAIYIKQGDNNFLVGKIVTSIFSDELGLNPKGDNLFKATKASGRSLYSSGSAKIIDRNLELSNANFSTSLINLMNYQRAFEGNSKTINTADDVLRTAIELKK